MNYLAIDVGGTSIKYALMDENAHFLNRGSIATPMDSLESYLSVLEAVTRPYAADIDGVAMCVPGIVDSSTGFCLTGGNLTFVSELPLMQILEERLGIPVTIENDAKCAALAELWHGSLQNSCDSIVIVLGSGVGGAIIKNRQVHKGKHFSAGEFSFLEMGGDIADEYNTFGKKNGLWALFHELSQKTGIPEAELDGHRVFQLARQGNTAVLQLLDAYILRLARLIFNLQAVYDPELFAIGGGISQQELLFTLLQKKLAYLYDNYPYKVPRASVVKCKFQNDSNLMGALYNHLQMRGAQGHLQGSPAIDTHSQI